ncbi:MAG: sulfate adenylyltransferase [Promethearchaeota archaeon]
MIQPHGGTLIDRTVSQKEKQRISASFDEYTQIQVGRELAQEIHNIAYGVFSPLEGFQTSSEFQAVLEHGRLSDDLPWTIPIVMDVERNELGEATAGDMIGLRYNGKSIALLEVEDIYPYDKSLMADSVYGTKESSHPGVAKIGTMKDHLVGGRIRLIDDIGNPYPEFTLSPKETRILFREKKWRTVVAFQTRNPPHLGHEYVQKTALSIVDGIFINPLIGKKKIGDFRDDVILQAYDSLMKHYYLQEHSAMSVLHTEMRYAGPKEAIHHAIMRKNFGCTHFIVGRDHAGVGDFYGPFDAQYIFDDYPDIEIMPIFFRSFFFCKKCNSIANDKTCPHGPEEHVSFAGRAIREMLSKGEAPSADLMRPEVAEAILSFEKPFVE